MHNQELRNHKPFKEYINGSISVSSLWNIWYLDFHCTFELLVPNFLVPIDILSRFVLWNKFVSGQILSILSWDKNLIDYVRCCVLFLDDCRLTKQVVLKSVVIMLSSRAKVCEDLHQLAAFNGLWWRWEKWGYSDTWTDRWGLQGGQPDSPSLCQVSKC